MKAFLVPGRRRAAMLLVVAIAAVVGVFTLGGASTHAAATTASGVSATGGYSGAPLCVQYPQLCTEQENPWTYNGYTYTSGHDEPSLLFYSHKAGSGNSNEYRLTLPTDPAVPPSQDGTGTTWNFQLHPAFWFGMAMCDDQSAPNPGVPCPADSDTNIHTGTDASQPNYIGLTPGSAFMEMQFYPPGWGPVSCTDGEGNTDGKWCSALTIDSDPVNQNTGTPNNPACQASQGPEPVNWAAITKSGIPVAPANPFTPFGEQAVVTDDTLEYSNGDQLVIDMHDTKAGFQVVIHDLTSGDTGSMTASTANGFGHALYEPNAHSCKFRPYAFHPMYSTSTPDTRVLWAAHSYNVAFSDEIGHFEYCGSVNTTNFHCNNGSSDGNGSNADFDDRACFPAPIVGPTGNTLSPSFSGCLFTDVDFDGPEYQQGTWPGSTGAVPGNVSTPIVFSSPLFSKGAHGGKGPFNNNYDQVAFETDLPRIEGSDSSTNNDCQRHYSNPADPDPGHDCINPPNGATFYPIYSTFNGPDGTCLWEEGGDNIAGATNNFGGNPLEYGDILVSNYPTATAAEGPFTVTQRGNNFHRNLSDNPCPSSTKK
ncbi:MAG TPA: hypothetical protein VJ814_00705 [Gaiellaceae bacterium]|nr:hypothetical protein [Gaiellaceae bacterium]